MKAETKKMMMDAKQSISIKNPLGEKKVLSICWKLSYLFDNGNLLKNCCKKFFFFWWFFICGLNSLELIRINYPVPYIALYLVAFRFVTIIFIKVFTALLEFWVGSISLDHLKNIIICKRYLYIDLETIVYNYHIPKQ